MRYIGWCVVITLCICFRWLFDVFIYAWQLSLKGGVYYTEGDSFGCFHVLLYSEESSSLYPFFSPFQITNDCVSSISVVEKAATEESLSKGGTSVQIVIDESSSKPTDDAEEEPSQEEEEPSQEGEVSSQEEEEPSQEEEETTVPPTVPPTKMKNRHSKLPVVSSSINSAKVKPVKRFQKKKKPKNPSQPPLKYLVIPPLEPEAIEKQQQRLDLFLNQTRDYQSVGLNENRVVFYKIHRESGLGNMIRGYVTSLAVALLTNRSIQFKTQRNFFFRFFIPPFPSMTASYSIGSRIHDAEEWDYFPGKSTKARLQSEPLGKWWNRSAVIITTYSDVSSSYLNPKFYQKPLEKAGILPMSDSFYSSSTLGLYFKSVILPLIMNPQPYLCKVINKYIEFFSQKKMIGIQMRLGGSKANYREKLFLGPKCVDLFIKRVNNVIQEKGWDLKNVAVFVSTDSTFALEAVEKAFNTDNQTIVYSVKEYAIGHSALAKTAIYSEKMRNAFMNRAIVDLLILKESDYLIYSQGSSYGQMAYELQQAYRYPVTPEHYLRLRNLQCSVFHPKRDFGEGSYVSKYFAKKKKKKS